MDPAAGQVNTLELAQYYAHLAVDPDFSLLIDTGLKRIIQSQIKKLEETMAHYRIPVPPRPPVDINLPSNIETSRDVHMFRIIFSASQAALLIHVKSINICTNDSLRNMFMGFLTDELHMYDNLVKYGKIKGWVHTPPAYKIC